MAVTAASRENVGVVLPPAGRTRDTEEFERRQHDMIKARCRRRLIAEDAAFVPALPPQADRWRIKASPERIEGFDGGQACVGVSIAFEAHQIGFQALGLRPQAQAGVI